MKNKLILGALAAVAVAPLTVSAAEVTYSGIVQSQFFLQDDTAAEDNRVVGGDVRFGFTVSETVGGLTGFATQRFDAETNGNLTGSALITDETVVGITNGATTFKLGNVTDVNFGRYANDIQGEGNDSGNALGVDGSAGALSYGLFTSPAGSDDYNAIGAEFDAGVVTVGASVGDDKGYDTSLFGVKTNVSGITLALHSWTKDNPTGAGNDGEDNVISFHAAGNAGSFTWAITNATLEDYNNKLRLDLGTSVAGLDASFRFEDTTEESNSGATEGSYAYIQLAKSF